MGVAAFGRKPPSEFPHSLRRSAETPPRQISARQICHAVAYGFFFSSRKTIGEWSSASAPVMA
jgi:hypothetical protein